MVQGTWSKVVIQTVLNLCKTGKSIKATAKKYKLACITLYRCVKSKVASPQLKIVSYLKHISALFGMNL